MNGSPQQSALRYRFSDEIPDSYGEALLNILPCNPFRIYLYWDLPPISAVDTSRWWLRYFVNEACRLPGSAATSEIEIPPASREWYLDLPYPGAAYGIELVRETADNAKVVVLQAGSRMPAAPQIADTAPSGQSDAPKVYCRPTDSLVTMAGDTQPRSPADAGNAYPTAGQPSSWALQGTVSQ